MSRKDALRAMLSRRAEKLPDGNSTPRDELVEERIHASSAHIRSGAVGAMGRSLGQIALAADPARALVAAGAAVVEIAANKFDASFVADRLADRGADYDRLLKAIAGSGQRNPILARPHPEQPDRYQIVFGHRRVRVLAELARLIRRRQLLG